MNTIDRVQAHTTGHVNRRLEDDARKRVLYAAREPESRISQRINELDREWDIERILEMNASGIALTGVLLSLFVSRKFLAIPIVVFSFLLLHAVQGWCPPVPILRRLGVRTRREIDREKYALKALRGDFAEIPERRLRHEIFESGSNAWQAAAS